MFGLEQLELDGRRGPGVAGDQVAELTQDVAAHLHHVLVARRRLEGLSQNTKS